jgi:hypothetical protein
MARYRVKEAGPALVQHIAHTNFHKLPVDERELALETLWELSPARAEALGLELLSKSGVLTREAVDDTRIAAITLLEKHSTRREVAEALASAATKWSNSQPVRQAASQAANAVRARTGAR